MSEITLEQKRRWVEHVTQCLFCSLLHTCSVEPSSPKCPMKAAILAALDYKARWERLKGRLERLAEAADTNGTFDDGAASQPKRLRCQLKEVMRLADELSARIRKARTPRDEDLRRRMTI